MSRAHVPANFPNRIQDLEKRVRILERTSKLNSATIGSGGLTVKDGGDITLEDVDGNPIWRATEDPIKTQGAWAYKDSISIPTSFTDFGYYTVSDLVIDVPEGFDGGHFLMAVAVGDSFSTSGNVTVQPGVRWKTKSGAILGPAYASGTDVNSGNSTVSVANSFWAANIFTPQNAADPIVSIAFGLRAARSGTEVASSGNWHCTVSQIWRRGGPIG